MVSQVCSQLQGKHAVIRSFNQREGPCTLLTSWWGFLNQSQAHLPNHPELVDLAEPLRQIG